MTPFTARVRNAPAARRAAISVAALAAGLAWSCGGATPAARVTGEFTAEHAAAFEDGVDYVDDPTVLEGRWREEWSSDLEKRVGWSDLIAIVTVTYVRTDTDLERLNTYRLVVKVERTLHGTAPSEELTLVVRQGEPGFATVEGNERRLLNEPFVAFVKWYQADASAVRPHWHLAPASQPIVRRVEYLVRRRSDVPSDTRQVEVIHQG